MKNKNIFKGENAVKNFLEPGSIGFTPIVELPKSLNKFKNDNVRIYIKLMQFLPLGNIKSIPAWEMLNLISKTDLKKINNLVEYSSGNTVLSLSILTKQFGIKNLNAVITKDVPQHKKNLLKLVGANILISDGVGSPDVFAKEGGVYEAKELGKKKGWHNMNQYTNKGSVLASSKYLGKEVWSQIGKELSIFVSSIGTSGTIYGAGKFLKAKNKKFLIVGGAIKKGSSIPGPRGEESINKLAFPWKNVVDEVYKIDTQSAYKESLSLIREGIFVGPSTGMQLSLINKMIRKLKKNKSLNKYKNQNGEIVIVFVGGDTMYTYIDEYFKILPEKYFKKERKIKDVR